MLYYSCIAYACLGLKSATLIKFHGAKQGVFIPVRIKVHRLSVNSCTYNNTGKR